MKKLLVLPILAACFFFPHHAQAAISNALATSSYCTAQTACTLSITEPGGVNDYLEVAMYLNTGASTDKSTGVTFNGVAMALLQKYLSGGDYLYVYGLAAPATGAHNIVINMSSATDFQSYTSVYSGVAQAGQPDSLGTVTIGPGNVSVTATSTVVAANSWQTMICAWQQGGIGAGTRAFFRKAGVNTGSGFFDSNGVVATGAKDMQVTGAALGAGTAGYCNLVTLSPVASATYQLWPLSEF